MTKTFFGGCDAYSSFKILVFICSETDWNPYLQAQNPCRMSIALCVCGDIIIFQLSSGCIVCEAIEKNKLCLTLSLKHKFYPLLVLGLPRHLLPQTSKLFIYGCVAAVPPRRMVCRGDAAKKKVANGSKILSNFSKYNISKFRVNILKISTM